MNIRELHVEGFGHWQGLSLRGFEPGINVIYGPNESGKTTLLEFVRSVLYGFGVGRQRYVPPKTGAAAGGSITFSANGRLRTLARRDIGDAMGHWRLSEPDGTVQHQPLHTSYAGVDESVFCRVFAVGLRELQELATLSDGEVAARMYEMGVSAQRSGLASAVRELRASRRRLLGDQWHTSPIGLLTDRAQQLRGELEELTGYGTRSVPTTLAGHVGESLRDSHLRLGETQPRAVAGLNARHARATLGLKETNDAIPPLEASLADLQVRLRIADAAASVGDRLRQRIECLREMESLGTPPNVPDDLARRLEVCKDHIRRRRRKIRELKRLREQVRDQIEKLEVNERWLRQGPQLAALAEQAEWAAAEAKRIAELQREIETLRAQIEAESPDSHRQAAPAATPAVRRHISPRDVKELKPLEKARRAAIEAQQQAEATAAELEQAAAAAAKQLQAALGNRRDGDLDAALAKATERVRELRRRVQLDQRIAHLEHTLSEQGQGAKPAAEPDPDAETDLPSSEPLLSVGSMVGLGAFFVLGGPLIFAWAVMSGPLSWFLGLLGVAGIATGVSLKYWREQRTTRQVEAVESEISALTAQIDEAKEQRKQLDQRLGLPAGKAAEKLREAERQLMERERLAPLDHAAQSAASNAADAQAQAEQAAAARQQAEGEWAAAVQQLGLPDDTTYQQICDLCRAKEETPPQIAVHPTADLRQQLQARERELQDARRGQQDFTLRVQRVFQELGLPAPVGLAAAKLQEVRKEIHKQDEVFRRRHDLLNQQKRFRRRIVRLCLQGKRWARRRRWLLKHAGVTSEVELYQKLKAFARHDELRAKLAELDHEITARLCGTATIDEVTAVLRQTPANRLGETRHALRAQFHAAQQQLADLRQRRDEFDAEIKRLVKDTSPAEKHLELSAIEEQLRQATDEWQVLATGSYFLDQVRHVYERERQPDVLREASRYLASMTEQKYLRVWTPLDEDVLRIDTAEGETLPVDVLSTGTREQLFLCLRMALARSYARRGVELPLVLDDVLVNFDTRRSLAAARLLCDYAGEGQQVLLFTCHEHIAQMFQALKVNVQTLPESGAARAELHDAVSSMPPAAIPSMLPTPPPSRGKPLPTPHAPAQSVKPGTTVKDLWAA